jgi:hypothetical protein
LTCAHLTRWAERSRFLPGRQPLSLPPGGPQVLNIFGPPLVIEPSEGQLSRGAGLLPIRQFDEGIGVTWSFADALDGPLDPDPIEHTFL